MEQRAPKVKKIKVNKRTESKIKKILEKIEEKKRYCRALADTYISLQKLRVASGNRIIAMTQQMDEIEDIRESVLNRIVIELKRMENEIGKEAEDILKDIPVYTEFLSKIKGLGPILSLKLLSINWDLTKDLSSWNAYCGLVPHVYKCQCEEGHKILLPYDPNDPKNPKDVKCYYVIDREKDKTTKQIKLIRCGAPIVKAEMAPCRKYKGYAFFWNPKARTIMWLIGTSFAKTGGFYKEIYKKWKQIYVEIKELKTGHAIEAAKRKAKKLFLAHFYQAYHEIEGLPWRIPYQFEYLQHGDFIHWTEVVKIDEGE